MESRLKVSAIIVAAGTGSRLGFGVPKAFVQLAGASLLLRTFRIVGQLANVREVVITVPAGCEKAARAEAEKAHLAVPLKITAGGRERQDSVRLALALTSAEAELVAVHDAARPFASPALFESCISAALRSGAAIAAVPLSDTLKRVRGNRICATLPRAGLWQAQTPQVFRRDILTRAHQQAADNNTPATDDADLVERIGVSVEVVDGLPSNLKITTPDDLRMGEALVRLVAPR